MEATDLQAQHQAVAHEQQQVNKAVEELRKADRALRGAQDAKDQAQEALFKAMDRFRFEEGMLKQMARDHVMEKKS